MEPNVELGFAGFIANLVNLRDPALLAPTLARGPLHQFHPNTTAVFLWHHGEFALNSHWGLPAQLAERYQSVPADSSGPLQRAFRENRFIQLGAETFISQCELLQVDRDLWRDSGFAWDDESFIVLVPIYGHGQGLGLFAFSTPKEVSLEDSVTLMGLAGTIALWTFANTNSEHEPAFRDMPILERDVVPLALTDRQCEILRLIEAGQSNSAIATTTGLSISTVKVELRRAMRVLRSPNRRVAASTARKLALLG